MKKLERKPLNLKELIDKKEEILANKSNKTALVFVKSLNAHIKLAKPAQSLIKDILDMDSNVDEYLIYECAIEPSLKDEALQKAYECVEPLEIVTKLFEVGEIPALAKEIMRLAGYVDGVKAIKN